MPTFDIVSQVDMQEVRNAVDQAQRELSTRFDFKGTDSSVELHENEMRLHSASEDRLKAVVQVIEEKLVKRKVSLKALDYGKPEEAAKGAMRQTITLKAGLSSDDTKAINKWIKESNGKKVSSTTQGDSIRVSGKKRDDLQAVIAGLKEQDFGLPLQFENFRE